MGDEVGLNCSTTLSVTSVPKIIFQRVILSTFADSGSSSSSEEERPKRSNVKNGEVGRRHRHSHSRSPSPRKRQKDSSPR